MNPVHHFIAFVCGKWPEHLTAPFWEYVRSAIEAPDNAGSRRVLILAYLDLRHNPAYPFLAPSLTHKGLLLYLLSHKQEHASSYVDSICSAVLRWIYFVASRESSLPSVVYQCKCTTQGTGEVSSAGKKKRNSLIERDEASIDYSVMQEIQVAGTELDISILGQQLQLSPRSV